MTTQLGDRLMVVYGPPGTGKTTRMLQLLETELEQLPPDQIAFTSFTRAARREAMDRATAKFQFSPEQFKWCKTLHGIGYAMLGMTNATMFNRSHQREFNERFRYDLTEHEEDEDGEHRPPMRSHDDALRSVHQWALNRCLTLREGWSKCPTRVVFEQLELYSQRLAAFKAEKKIWDFTDMLLEGMHAGMPPVSVAFIDEAQDLTPLQIKAVYQWFGGCDRVYVAGDDDQAIYQWAGADPAWLIDLQTACTHHEILKHSYRVPAAVHTLAGNIIKRNKRRVQKPYESAKPGGNVAVTSRTRALEHVVEVSKDFNWTTFILVRNRFLVDGWLRDLMAAGVCFISESGGTSPMTKQSLIKAIQAGDRLLRGKEIEGEDLRTILNYVPSRGEDFQLPRGVKTRAQKHKGKISRMQLILEWQLGDLVRRLEAHGPALGLYKEKVAILQYLDLLLKRGWLTKEPNVRVMTVHASKGREANTVVVSSDMAKASWLEWRESPEGENRVAYVAVTRAKDQLVICDPITMRFYPYWEYMR